MSSWFFYFKKSPPFFKEEWILLPERSTRPVCRKAGEVVPYYSLPEFQTKGAYIGGD